MKTIEINNSLQLKELALSDAPAMFSIIDSQRAYLGEWLPFIAHTRQVSDSEAFIRSVTDAPEERRELVFAIMIDGEFSGLIGFKDTDSENHKTEIGYWISKDKQGRGVVTSAVRAMCHLAFDTMEMSRIQIKCAVGNYKSSNVPKRLGFFFEGVEREGELQTSGKYSDVEVFSLLAREFYLINERK